MSGIPKETKCIKPMPLLPFMTSQTLNLCANLPLQPNDIFICSYPKSGTTWTQHIVISILLCHRRNINFNPDSKAEDIPYEHVSQFAPFFEVASHWDEGSENLNAEIQHHHKWLGWRIFNTHLRWDMLPKSPLHVESITDVSKPRKPKFIFLMRSPLDVCVSFFHHLSNQVEGGFDGDFDDFFRKWIKGEIAFGSWVDHTLSFLNGIQENREHILLLSYEEMLSNLPQQLDKIISFLELDTSITSEQRKNLLPTFEFDSMKQSLDRFQPRSVTWKNKFQFLRKGTVGDSKNIMNEHQQKLFQEWIEAEKFVDIVNSCEINADQKKLLLSLIE